MSLQRRNNAHNKSNARQWTILIVAVLLLGIFSVIGVSFARYVGSWIGRFDTEVAQWNMKVNGISLADAAAASKITVTMVPVSDGVAAPSGKINPGQSGYFDIEIDPDGTETSFTYYVKVDATSKLPNGMSIDGYSVNGGNRIELAADADKLVENTVTLPDAGKFTADDKVTVRFYWTWADVAFDDTADYDLVVTASVVQYSGEGTEGGQTL